MARRHIPPEVRAAIVEALRAGASVSDLAATHGVHVTSVRGWARAAGLARRVGRPPEVPAATVRAVRAGLQAGLSPTVLAREHRVSRTHVRELQEPGSRLDARPIPAELAAAIECSDPETSAEGRRLADVFALLSVALERAGAA